MGKQIKGVDYPKYVNHEYFNELNTEKKLYLLGLIYADGSIVKPKGNKQKNLRLVLQEDDKDIVEEFCKETTIGREMKIYNPPSVSSRGWKKKAFFSFSSDKICNKLIELGCLINKSAVGMSFDFSNLTERQVAHFIRGFFDGDGCCYVKLVKNRYKRKTTYILKRNFKSKLSKRVTVACSSESFLKEILKMLQKFCNLTSKPLWNNRLRKEMVYVLSIEGQEDVQKIKEFFYKDATIFMKRKFDKFNMSIKSQAENGFSEGLETT